MSPIVEMLFKSNDPLERDLARTLVAWQKTKAERGHVRSLGYEPRDIATHGAIYVIETRVRNGSDGFDDVSPDDSYEAIVCKYPDRFAPDVVAIATRRLEDDKREFAPTTDPSEFDTRVAKLRSRAWSSPPKGNLQPARHSVQTNQFLRDPRIQAYVLDQAKGRCELCDVKAPFLDRTGNPYLEVHHVKPLAENGSDTVSNSIALCPNCHRATHLSSESSEVTNRIYLKSARLIRE